MNTEPVLTYIRGNWERSIYHDADGSGFRGMDLPHPYTSPCIKGEGKFSFFFYWDTYFTNLGLLLDGHAEMAKNNIRNMLWFIERQGYMPNHTAIFNRSQPPYLCRMVEEYFEARPEEVGSDFFRACCEGLRREYHFWTTARHTSTGLQGHGHHDTKEGCIHFYDNFLVRRLGMPVDAPDSDKARIGGHHLAEAESGCDFSPRFDKRCLDHVSADLNGLLYGYETFLGRHTEALGWDDANLWKDRAESRRERVNRYLWDESNDWFMDYDFINGRPSAVPTLAAMTIPWNGLATPEQAAGMAARLPDFERNHGIAVTPDLPGCRGYQWAYPNVWPPSVWVAVMALQRYGFIEDAKRIAHKFVAATERLFEKSGQLWEKTDAETGEVAGGEYEAAPMMGWSAGIYVALKKI
ncbi:MAG: trehalase family glycosidase [Oceanipulchritudo sp.]